MKNLNQQSEIINRFNVTELEDRFEMKKWGPPPGEREIPYDDYV